MKFHRIALTVALMVTLVAVFSPASAQNGNTLTDIERLRTNDIQVEGFELTSEQKVSIEAVGIRAGSRRNDIGLSNAWILNSKTREVVWELIDAKSEDADDDDFDLRIYSDEVTLPAGVYEVYYASWPAFYGSWDSDDDDDDGWWDNVWDNMKGDYHGYDKRDYRRAAKEFRITVTGSGKRLYESDIVKLQEDNNQDALLSLREQADDEYHRFNMKLERPMKLDIYAVGEVNKDGNYDYAWIVNAETREVIWKLDYRGSDRAGGAKKNRMVQATVDFKAGAYTVYAATDDSHHFDDWNSTPPYDPFFWGVTIKANDPSQARYAKISDYEEVEEKNVVMSLAPLRDDEFEAKGFSLSKTTKLRVYAIGEGYDRDMADYAWILDANSGETVWELSHRKSDHAGGASKNRVIDEVIELPKGNYMAYAVTDGSHAYRDWNAAAPHDRDHWGMTLYALNSGSLGNVGSYEEKDDPNVVAAITRVGDNEYERVRFTIDKATKVRMYALGEGQGGQMYDYAWLENRDTGRAVWEMTYRTTSHAGGAKKNRLFNEVITLEPGEYVLYYESDGSHSFDDWNATPPSDILNWGVTVRIVE